MIVSEDCAVMHSPACMWEACWTCLAAAGLAGHLLAICWYHGAPLAMASVAVLLPAVVTLVGTLKRCLVSCAARVFKTMVFRLKTTHR